MTIKAQNKNLHDAKKNKNDEFYTRFEDIERELCHYHLHFKGKTIFCNCDDPVSSNFVKYFALCFEHLELKRLIATHYDNSSPSYWADITHGVNSVEEMEGYQRLPLSQNGDFRSEESVNFLKQSDIVVTNPPFSLFREYLAQLMEHEKKFLIIGNVNAITYKEIFPLIKDNKMWWGVSPRNMVFTTPDNESVQVNSVWYTNLEHKKRKEKIILFREYKDHEEDFPKYDNYDAIEVSKVVNIPKDYNGTMGLPVTFLDKYNPNQFEIIKFRKGNDDKDLSINGKCPYFRILTKRRG